MFTDSSFLNLQGRVQYFSFKGFLVENSPGFIYINEYGNFWSQTNVDISHNIFRDNYNQENGGGALDMNSVHGRVAYNIFANNSGQGLGGAIYANDVHCDFNNNVF